MRERERESFSKPVLLIHNYNIYDGSNCPLALTIFYEFSDNDDNLMAAQSTAIRSILTKSKYCQSVIIFV